MLGPQIHSTASRNIASVPGRNGGQRLFRGHRQSPRPRGEHRGSVIDGSGPGAVRYCEFSTGPFVEPIQVWDEPRLLRFQVTENPAPMHEWSPYAKVLPKHLHGYLVSKQGQFLL